MNLAPLPAFSDNYIWMLHDGTRAVVVDPGDAAPAHQALVESGVALAAILVTHHHADHIGGVNALQARLQGPVYGPAHETIPTPCEPLLAITPFLRCTEPEVVASASVQGATAQDAINVLAALREWKNRYR